MYTGRDIELNSLIRSWEKVRSGSGPHLHVVRGERGMGKTRLVQEFYRHLAREEDPDNYWPDEISKDGNTLLTGPDPDIDPAIRKHFLSFALNERQLPFLWWGFRIADPEQRNVIKTGLAEHSRTLTPHLVSLVARYNNAILRNQSRTDVAKGVFQETISDIGTDVLEGILGEIPGVSSASTIYNIGKRIRELRKIYQEKRNVNTTKQNSQIGHLYDVANQDIQDTVMDELSLLNPTQSKYWTKLSKNDQRNFSAITPAVIFIDDAQFAGPTSGSGSLALLAKFWMKATAQNLPVLLIATHWTYEWNRGLGESPPENAEQPESFVAGFQPRSENEKSRFSETVLGKNVDLSALLIKATPQLSKADRTLILNKSDGNPMLLREISERLTTRNLGWCDDQGLTSLGRKRLQEKTFRVHELIRDRMETSTPDAIRKAILLSALQGVEFIESITLKVAAQLNLDLGADALRLANTPHGFINFLDNDKAAFIQRAIYDAAMTLFDDVFEDKTAVQNALRIATETLISEIEENRNEVDGYEYKLQNLEGLVIGYGLDSNDPNTVDEALQKLETEIDYFRNGEGRPRNYAAAAELAEKWWATVQTLNWPLNIWRYHTVSDVLETAYGPLAVEQLINRALLDARQLLEANDTFDTLRELSFSLNKRGILELALSRPNAAKQYFTESFDIVMALAEKADSPSVRRDIGVVIDKLGVTELELSRPERARAHFKESLEISRALAEENSTPETREDLSVCLYRLGDVEIELLQPEDARPYYMESLEICRTLALELDTLESRRSTAMILDKIGNLESRISQNEAAKKYYQESLEIAESIATETNTHQSRRDVSVSLDNLGNVEIALSHYQAGKAYFEKSLEVRRGLINEADTPSARSDLLRSIFMLGDIELALSRPEMARDYFEECYKICRNLVRTIGTTQSRRDLAVALNRLGCVEMDLFRPQGARVYFEEHLELCRVILTEIVSPKTLSSLSVSLERLGDLEMSLSCLEVARAYFEESLEIRRTLALEINIPKIYQGLSNSLRKLGEVELALLRPEKARTYIEESLEISRALAADLKAPDFRRDLSVCLDKLGAVEIAFSRPKAALTCFRESLEIAKTLASEIDTVQAHKDHKYCQSKLNAFEKFLKSRNILIS